ncbi:MAG TPA: YfbU family protein [Methylophilaceae bacterium]|nr:YfbU family protein [Methylophilaceae bacterium]HSI28985.1 YfbU family protein [Methylophilus sp.]
MKLTNAEKLILVMLSDITEKLHIDHGIDPKLVKSAIHSGNTWGLDWKYPGLGKTDQAAPAIANEITDILEMWTYIEEAYKDLTSDEKSRVKIDAGLSGPPRFSGFDGDSELEFHKIAYFLIYDLKLFKKFKMDTVDAPGPKMPEYKRMFKIWGSVKPNLAGLSLNANQLVEILKVAK